MTRECRIAGCTTRHPNHLFCCQWHWFQLPQPMRDAIWDAYRSQEGVLGTRYAQAAENAEAFLENREPRDIAAA